MKNTSRKFFGLLLISVFLSASACAQNQLTNSRFETVKLKNGKNLNYAIHLPTDYDPSKAYPTIIGPGNGVREDSPSYYWHGSPSDFG